MDAQSRQTASAYLNNLLLSRGLLRNGIPIEFAKPDEVEGGIHGTMSQVMNMVHDLILRRDRDSETLSTLSQSTQTLRATSTQQGQNVSRLEVRTSDLERQLALMTAQERSAQATLRSAETRNRALREEMARMKSNVAQIRAQCATDIRRRDGEITRLKRHLEGRRARDGGSSQVGVVVVTPGINKNQRNGAHGAYDLDIDSPEYSLKQETTDFLTELSQGLSDENDNLIGLVQGTLATLRSLQGLPVEDEKQFEANADPVGLCNEEGVVIGPPSYDTLASNTDIVLEHLRGLLTNPSFVPLEEVEIREEEIHRLREGWEMMAERWREAVALMAGWRRRVVDHGDTIKLEDLKLGLKLGSGIPSAQEARQSPFKLDLTGKVSSDALDAPRLSNEADDPVLDDSIDDIIINDDLIHPDEDMEVQEQEAALQERSINIGTDQGMDMSNIAEESTKDLENVRGRPSKDVLVQQKPNRRYQNQGSKLPRQKRERSASPDASVPAKLELARQEAENARKRAEKRSKQPLGNRMVNKKLKGSRRRSTLSPQELESLVGIF